MYQATVFLHVLSVFIFMLAHGATATVMFRLGVERNPDQIRGLLVLRKMSELPFFISSTLMFLTGVALGFMGDWWGTGWIWASLVLLVAISIVMGIFGRNFLDRVGQAVGVDPRGKPIPASSDSAALEDLLGSAKPMMLTLIGVGGFVVILWLMMFKPF